MAQASSQVTVTWRRKLAFVVGIGDYKYVKLKNAEKDANSMASKLSSIGFIVTKAINLTHDEIEASIFKFRQFIQKGDMVLFYFSEHGIQWEVSDKDF